MKMKILRWCSLLLCALMLGWGSQVWADPAEGEADEPPEYQNDAQVAHDANLATAYFDKVDAEAAKLKNELTGLDPVLRLMR